MKGGGIHLVTRNAAEGRRIAPKGLEGVSVRIQHPSEILLGPQFEPRDSLTSQLGPVGIRVAICVGNGGGRVLELDAQESSMAQDVRFVWRGARNLALESAGDIYVRQD